MNLRTLLLPVALAGGLALLAAQPAQASPIGTMGTRIAHAPLGGVRVGVGGGVSFPIGGPHYARGGYWAVQTVPMQVQVQVPYEVAVQVPHQVVGRDVYGHPIWSYRTEVQTQYRTEIRTQYVQQQVWVPVVYRPRPWGHVGFGVRF